tara:strand:+ start:566 stop:1054 length:489 start_codon:yes stop_codon:yes gene_type:complete
MGTSWPYREEDDAYEGIDDDDDLDIFVKSVNRDKLNQKLDTYNRTDFSNRADRSSMTKTRWNLSLAENIPGVRKGMSPMSSKSLYPQGFTGPSLGGGGTSQAFRTTGNYKRTGTQFGTSRAPLPIEEDEPGLEIFNLKDLLDPDTRSLLKKRLKLLKVLSQN